MMTPEGRVKKQIRNWLREQGAYIFSPVQMGFGASTLDLLVCWNGRFVGIEVKAPGKTPTDRQCAICDEITMAGGQSIIAWSLEDVAEILT
jgi:hypothetical protein